MVQLILLHQSSFWTSGFHGHGKLEYFGELTQSCLLLIRPMKEAKPGLSYIIHDFRKKKEIRKLEGHNLRMKEKSSNDIKLASGRYTDF